MKMRALLRYRRLPFIWEPASPRLAEAFRTVRPAVVPVLQYPDGHFANDSTLLAADLELRHPDQRSVLPGDRGLAFICHLLEDFADEWLTKCMFHYRWWYAADRTFASIWVVGDRFAAAGHASDGRADGSLPQASVGNPVAGPMTAADLENEIGRFHDRQVGRMALVGVTEANKAAVEQSYALFLETFDEGIGETRFMFGSRPSLADFAWFGQMWTLAMDPTPGGLMRSKAPHLLPWLLRLDDASGVEGNWHAEPTTWCVRLLALAGRIYLPFLKANAQALKEGATTMALDVLGHPYSQAPFKYQAKCYAELRSKFEGLPQADRRKVTPLLEESGCLPFLI